MEVIYKDNDIIALNKPAGIPVHPDHFHRYGTVIQQVIKDFPDIQGVGDDYSRPGVVHRLDKDTSGILIVCRNNDAFNDVKKQFQERSVKKEYMLLVVGDIKNKNGMISLPIGRSKNDPTKRIARGAMRGKIREAVTGYKVIEHFIFDKRHKNQLIFTLIRAIPMTGRTHQIRSHFAAIGYPVVCDKLYAGKRYVCPFGLGRHFLHALALEFTLPSGGRIRLEADMPDDLKNTLKNLRSEN